MKLMTTEELKEQRMTKPEVAKHYGLKNFDTAIPQGLFDQLATDTFDPWGHYVYCYDSTSLGILFPLTAEAKHRMEAIGLDFVNPVKDSNNEAL